MVFKTLKLFADQKTGEEIKANYSNSLRVFRMYANDEKHHMHESMKVYLGSKTIGYFFVKFCKLVQKPSIKLIEVLINC